MNDIAVKDAETQYKELISHYKPDLVRVEQAIRDNFHSDVALIPQISGYLAEGGGKRLRPSLVIVGSRLCGFDGDETHITLSVVVEYIHAATLLHDDVVDEADLRRGKKSANAMFGNQAAVLVGDFLYARSFDMMSAVGDMRVVKTISAATKTLAEGEVLQLIHQRNIGATENNYMETIWRKTGALIEASCRIGAILGNATSAQEDALAAYGKSVGLAFQLVDDAQDYVADAAIWGKPLGADLAEGKITMPMIHALQHCRPEEREFVAKVITSPEPVADALPRVIEMFDKYGSVEYTLRRARDFVNEAKESLAGFPASSHRDTLAAVADYVVARKV